jgi:hypothetical protein
MPDQSTDSPEAWRPVLGYEGWYEVSDLGRVRRVRAGPATRPGRILRPHLGGVGYPQVCLSRNNEHLTQSVHRLVALAFLPRESPNQRVNHIDGVKVHAAARNLEWVTDLENHRHAARTGLMASGARQHLAKLTPQQIAEIRSSKATGAALARRFGVHKATVNRVRAGKTWRRS